MALPPHLAFIDRRYAVRSVRYSGRQTLDIWSPEADGPSPIMIFVPGGAWVSGSRATRQGHALMSRMVERGWTCLSIDYRTAPRHRWPAPLEDVVAAVGWARYHAREFGADPNFVAIAGASAGGHLATLTALTPRLVDAAVSLYGSYDWTDRSTLWRKIFMDYLERVVVGRKFAHCPDVFEEASPMHMIHPESAPLMMVHGSWDTLIRVSEAREFQRQLSHSSRPVQYLEIPRGLHAFDLINPRQTVTANRAIADFLQREYAHSMESRAAS